MAEATTQIEIDDMVTVGTLAERLSIPVSGLITELMKNGVMATVNEKIDFDTAQIIVEELGLELELVKKASDKDKPVHKKAKGSDKAISRPPVVAVMGHVDHGKTSLLDRIRGSHVADKEAGGITQHISAYQIEHKNRAITFLDTPGHEAFAAIREHGAMLTDIVIVVVAADDGIKPQTIEAIRYAKKAGVKIIVAVNKIDKDGADSNRIKQQLSENDLLIEEWGGDTVLVEVSAKTGTGVDSLLDMILLVTDIEELKADIDVPASGLIIEAHVETGRGPIARALVEAGILKVGDYIVAGSSYAKVKTLENDKAEAIKSAGPSTPVTISGFKTLPEFGDEFSAYDSEKAAKEAVSSTLKDRTDTNSKLDISSNELIRLINRNNQISELNIIVKADVQGSLKSVIDSLKALDTDEVSVRFVATGVGPVSENDIRLATTTSAIIYGFGVTIPPSSRRQAKRDSIVVRQYNVIYELIDDVKEELTKLLKPEVVETELGKLIIKGVFNTTKTEVICGGEVTTGRLQVPSLARVKRDKETIATVEVTNLKKGPNDVKDVLEGEMCGVNLKTTQKLDIQEGDKLEVFRRETLERKL
ncbi:MAG: translation initiation factor IF-2 [Candidatus Saccharibacteria bacterium]